MAHRLLILTLTIILFPGLKHSFAQVSDDIDEHQIFYEDPVQKVKDAEYDQNSKSLQYELRENGKTLILKNYDGESKVNVTYVNQKGETVEKTHYSCYIHPKPPS